MGCCPVVIFPVSLCPFCLTIKWLVLHSCTLEASLIFAALSTSEGGDLPNFQEAIEQTGLRGEWSGVDEGGTGALTFPASWCPQQRLPHPPIPVPAPPITLPSGPVTLPLPPVPCLLHFTDLPTGICHLLSALIVRPWSPCFLPVLFVLLQCKLMWDMPWPLSCYLPLGILRKTVNYIFFHLPVASSHQ